MISFGFFIIFYLHIFPSKTFAACYKPNGIDVNEQLDLDDYQPCDGGDDESMCCALNRLYPDKCRSDGLCSGYRYPDIAIWRDSCTDPTWKSPKCLKLCINGSWKYTNTSDTADMHIMDVTITSCNDGSYCCGNGTNANQCCDNKEGVFMLNGDPIPYHQFRAASSISTGADVQSSASLSNTFPSSIPPSTFSTSPPGISSFPGLSAQSASSAPSPSPNSRVIPATVFGTCAALLLIGALVFFVRKFRPQQPRKPQISLPRPLPLEMLGDNGSNELDGYREFELDRPGNYPEMPTNVYRFFR